MFADIIDLKCAWQRDVVVRFRDGHSMFPLWSSRVSTIRQYTSSPVAFMTRG